MPSHYPGIFPLVYCARHRPVPPRSPLKEGRLFTTRSVVSRHLGLPALSGSVSAGSYLTQALASLGLHTACD